MTTRRISVTHDPQQITDGKSCEVIQFNGSVLLCDSPTKPASDAPAFHFPSSYRYQTLTITPPTVAWIWASEAEKTVEVVIL